MKKKIITASIGFVLGIIVTMMACPFLWKDTTWLAKTDITPQQNFRLKFTCHGPMDYLSGGGRLSLTTFNAGHRSEYPLSFHFENPHEARVRIEKMPDGTYVIFEDRTGVQWRIDERMNVTFTAPPEPIKL